MSQVILLAEDFEDDIAHLQLVFKRVGVANPVVIVRDGDEVISYIEGQGQFSDRLKYPPPSILLLDLKMSRVGGFEVLEWLRLRPSAENMLIVILTGNDGIWDMKRAYSLGAHSFLVKPCHSEDIINLWKSFPGHWMFESKPDVPLAPPDGGSTMLFGPASPD